MKTSTMSRSAAILLLLLGSLAVSRQESSAQDIAEELKANGILLHTVSIGSGVPIVMVHGGPGLDHGYLLPGMQPLGRTHRLILYDQRGVGRSGGDLDSASINMDNYLRDLDGLRVALGLERLNLAGHSFGGLIAMLYAIRYPDRVESLILINTVEPGQRFRAQQAERQRTMRTPEDSAAIARLLETEAFRTRQPEVVSEIMRLSFRSTFADPSKADRLSVNLAPGTAKNGSRVAELLVGPLGAYDFWEELSGIRARTLIIHGEKDVIPLEMAEQLRVAVPGAELLVVPGAGHFPHLEEPAVVFNAIRRFVR